MAKIAHHLGNNERTHFEYRMSENTTALFLLHCLRLVLVVHMHAQTGLSFAKII